MTHRIDGAVEQQIAAQTERETIAEILPPRPVRSERHSAQVGHPITRPIGLALGVSIVALTASWMAARAMYGGDLVAEFRKAVHADATTIAAPVRDNLNGLRPGEIALTLSDDEGRVVRVAAQRLSLIHISEPTRPY